MTQERTRRRVQEGRKKKEIDLFSHFFSMPRTIETGHDSVVGRRRRQQRRQASDSPTAGVLVGFLFSFGIAAKGKCCTTKKRKKNHTDDNREEALDLFFLLLDVQIAGMTLKVCVGYRFHAEQLHRRQYSLDGVLVRASNCFLIFQVFFFFR